MKLQFIWNETKWKRFKSVFHFVCAHIVHVNFFSLFSVVVFSWQKISPRRRWTLLIVWLTKCTVIWWLDTRFCFVFGFLHSSDELDRNDMSKKWQNRLYTTSVFIVASIRFSLQHRNFFCSSKWNWRHLRQPKNVKGVKWHRSKRTNGQTWFHANSDANKKKLQNISSRFARILYFVLLN